MRIGLVLGGGGMVGLAYHSGVLAALHAERQWDPRDAEVIVGTSAGSVAGGLLRLGLSVDDLRATLLDGDRQRAVPEFPPMRAGSFLRRPRRPNLALLGSWATRPWRMSPLGVVVSVLPDGEHDLFTYAESFPTTFGDVWPARDLWLTAVRQRDLVRVVFGTELPPVPLSRAVAASCAIPGYFAPIEIGSERFVDGGVSSPTNADVLRTRDDLDLVVIVSPMSARDRVPSGIERAVRGYATRRLEGEVNKLRKAGLSTLVLQPGAEVIEGIGLDFMSTDRLAEVNERAYVDTQNELRRLAATVRTEPAAHRTTDH